VTVAAYLTSVDHVLDFKVTDSCGKISNGKLTVKVNNEVKPSFFF